MNKAKKRIDFLCYLGLGFGSLMVLIPIIYLASTSFKSISEIMTSGRVTLFPQKFSTEAYHNIITEYPFFTYLLFTPIIFFFLLHNTL